MKKIFLLLIILWVCCGHIALDARHHPTLPEPTLPVEPLLLRTISDKAACRQWVDSVMNQLSLKERIGQLFIYTLAPRLEKSNLALMRKVVEEYGVGGLLFSGGEASNQAELTNRAQALAKVPLMITFDGEWGLAMRLKGTPVFPKNAVLGCIRNDDLLYEYGREMAHQCREMGVQVNFAPVADVNINPKNPVINVRSFGEVTSNVTKKVIAYATGLEEGGVLAVCKHFPGHGDTDVDSHYALPTLPFTRERLDSIELYPFQQAIRAGTGGIMVGHLAVPALEPTAGLPASLSERIVGDLLSKELKFQGLIFTDALIMKGVAGHEALCLKALEAGNDLLLTPQELRKELESVVAAVERGELSEEFIEEKCRKVLTYKYAMGLHQKPAPIQRAGLESRLDTPYVRDLIRRLQEAAITATGNESNLLPLDSSVKEVALLHVGSATKVKPFLEQLSEEIYPVEFSPSPNMGDAARTALIKKVAAYPCVLVCVTESNLASYSTLFAELLAELPTVVNLFFIPDKQVASLTGDLSHAAANLLVHSAEEAVQRQTARILCGKGVADGELSAAIGTLFAAGEGVRIGSPIENLNEESTENLIESSAEPQLPSRSEERELVRWAKVDSLAQAGIREGAYPGCQVIVLKEGETVYHKAFGTHTGVLPSGVQHPVQLTDLYDIASLTKTTATLLAVMKLYEEGKLNLNDRLSDYLPFLRNTDKRRITIKEVLFHQSGLPATILFYLEAIDKESYSGTLFKSKSDKLHSVRTGQQAWANPNFSFYEGLTSPTRTEEYTMQVSDGLWLHRDFKEKYLQKIVDTPLKEKRYRYSCVGFILLQQVVEMVTGMGMDEYLNQEFYKPMGLTRTAYLPLRFIPGEEIVPSAIDPFLRRDTLRGYVHDESAAFLGGISGNAGLFSTAEEVASIYQMLLNEGVWKGRRYLQAETCRLFTTTVSPNSRRGLGFDKPDVNHPQASPCAPNAPASVYGHTGFTGTCAWVDPDNRLVYVFLSNRTYPQSWINKLHKLQIREQIQEAIYQALEL